jgi:hypothetical protein
MPFSVASTNVSGQFVLNMSMAVGEAVMETGILRPFDLNGYQIKMQIDFAAPLVLSTGNGGIVITNPDAGEFQIKISSATSEQFQPGKYPYEFWVISGDGMADRLWAGNFTVLPSITPIP